MQFMERITEACLMKIKVYKNDFHAARLEIHLDTSCSSLQDKKTNINIHDVLMYIKSISPAEHSLQL